jgi:hypothetical protein
MFPEIDSTVSMLKGTEYSGLNKLEQHSSLKVNSTRRHGLSIISVDFSVTDKLLNRHSATVRWEKKCGST